MSETQPQLTRWENRKEELLADCKVFTVYQRQAYHPVRDVEAPFYIIHSPEWIQAVALTPEKEIILVNQYRFGRDVFSWEMPGGLLDEGEEATVGAARELVEETGYVGKNPIKLGECSPNPAIQNNKAHFILFEDCTLQESQKWDTHEEIEVGVFPIEEAFRMAADGRIHNTITYNALFFLQQHLNA